MKQVFKGLILSAAVLSSTLIVERTASSKEGGSESHTFTSSFCSHHAPSYKVTIDEQTVRWTEEGFYGRREKHLTLNRSNGHLQYYFQTDKDLGQAPIEAVYQMPQTEYIEGLQTIAKTLDQIVVGYACNPPRPEAEPIARMIKDLVNSAL